MAYISKYLSHFVGRGKKENEQYDLLVKILKDYKKLCNPKETDFVLKINPKGKITEETMFLPNCVCFCDIPTDNNNLSIHVGKYSKFGIAFTKDFIARHGGAPVSYVPLRGLRSCGGEIFDFCGMYQAPLQQVKGSHMCANLKMGAYEDMMGKYFDFDIKLAGSKSDELNQLFEEIQKPLELEIFSRIKFYDHHLADSHNDNYYFEREWRVLGEVSFSLGDVKKIYVSKLKYKHRLKQDVPEYNGKVKILWSKGLFFLNYFDVFCSWLDDFGRDVLHLRGSDGT